MRKWPLHFFIKNILVPFSISGLKLPLSVRQRQRQGDEGRGHRLREDGYIELFFLSPL